MRLLLDTHAFLWWIVDDNRLSSKALQLISNGGNEVFFSTVSAWEIVVKTGLGRVELPEPVERFLPAQLHANGFQVLPIHLSHALGVGDLPEVHKDPFDRMLVSQAVIERMTIVSGDRQLHGYPVAIEW